MNNRQYRSARSTSLRTEVGVGVSQSDTPDKTHNNEPRSEFRDNFPLFQPLIYPISTSPHPSPEIKSVKIQNKNKKERKKEREEKKKKWPSPTPQPNASSAS